jgi:hypothetical protein
MKSTKKTKPKTKKTTSDELRKPTKMAPAKEKEKNNWKSQASDDFDDLEEPVMDDNFKGFDEFSDEADEDEDDY